VRRQAAGRCTIRAAESTAGPSNKTMIARELVRRVRVSTIVALATFAVIVIRAWVTVDPYWDTLAYHWAFAARTAGLCDRDCFLFPYTMEARYDGFPLAMHTLQGWLWRLIGTPGAADLVNVAAVGALCLYMRWRFAVPLAWCWLALLAIPEVQIELTSSFIDVPVNAAATIGILVVVRMLLEPQADHRADVAIALAALGLAAGSKFLVVPLTLLAWLAIVVLAARSPRLRTEGRREATLVLLVAAGIVVLLPKLAANTLAYGNPFYPIAFDVGTLHFAGAEPVRQTNTISTAWAETPAPFRWIVSVLEFDAFRGRPLPWLLGQGDVPQSSPSFRMGGYFVGYVLGALVILGWSVRAAGPALRLALVVAALSVLCMLLPNSHELRYYLFWMMTLVGAVLIAAHSPLFGNHDQVARRRATHALIAIALATVVSMTGGAFVRTRGTALAELIAPTNATIASLPDGATLCIRNFDRRAFLYADVFHPGRHYRTRQLLEDDPDPSCTVRLSVP
jgi:hypothetical protein